MARTAYWVVDLSSYGNPSAAEIAAGQRAGGAAALRSGSESFAATSGSGTITEATTVTGLTPGTSYRLSWVIYDDVALSYSGVEHAVFVPTPTLVAADAAHAHTAAAPTLSSAHLLTVADAQHGHAADGLGLSTASALAAADAMHAHAADNLTLGTTGSASLAAADASHAHAADNLGLTSAHTLASAYRSHTEFGYGSRTNTTYTAPSGIADGDQLILVFVRGQSGSAPATPTAWPSGFSLLSVSAGSNPRVVNDGSYYETCWVLTKIADGESGSYTVTHTTGDTWGSLICATGGTVAQATEHAGTGTTTTAKGLTTGADDSLIVLIDKCWNSSASPSAPSGSTPTFTRRSAITTSLHFFTGVLGSAGATGDKSRANENYASEPWRALLVEVRATTGSATLAPDAALHGHTADSPGLSTAAVLALADAMHGHQADSATLGTTVHTTLTPADAAHAHAADNLGLSTVGSASLGVANALHAHSADNLVLTSHLALVVQDAAHAHMVEGVVFSTQTLLAVQDALHAHLADNAALSDATAMQIASGLHAHSADGLALTVDAWLVADDAQHGHSAGNVVLLVPGGTVWPDPATVLAGVVYGPNGSDYTGTLQLLTAAQVVAALQAVCIPVNVKQVNDVVIQGTGAPPDHWRPA